MSTIMFASTVLPSVPHDPVPLFPLNEICGSHVQEHHGNSAANFQLGPASYSCMNCSLEVNQRPVKAAFFLCCLFGDAVSIENTDCRLYSVVRRMITDTRKQYCHRNTLYNTQPTCCAVGPKLGPCGDKWGHIQFQHN